MKNIIPHLFIFFLLSSFIGKESSTNKNHLFKIERSKDANEIFYDLNITTSNELNTKNPINIYWIRHTEGDKVEPLTWIQKNYAYGVKYTKIKKNKATFEFVSYNKKQFIIKKDEDNIFHVYTQLNNKEVIINRIFIHLDGGTFWFPKIPKIELHTTDIINGKENIEIIKP